MKVAKQFTWEAAHRLPWHTGACKNLHGHSYKMTVELEGDPDERGMLIDFKEIKKILSPLIEDWDHATLVADDDIDLRYALEELGSRQALLPYDSTAENLSRYTAEYLMKQGTEVLRTRKIHNISVTVRETDTCYATFECPVVFVERKGLFARS
ncbi:MAG: 6-carboxytetrahydropterin synthase [Rhodothermales bacterium]|nr:6-carboxytetrahydropterin synthase [Rhodothermales bacterium]